MSAGSTTAAVDSGNKWPPPQGAWTFADYERLPDNGKRYEIIEGHLYMSPAPQTRHQKIIVRLVARLQFYLEKSQLGEILVAPTDVRFPDVVTNVQPDLVFVGKDRLEIIQKARIEGSPDLVVEVLSPKHVRYDRSVKFDAYAEAEIREYWIVDPENDTIEVNVLRGTAYAPIAVFSGAEQVRSEVLPDFELIAADIFPPA